MCEVCVQPGPSRPVRAGLQPGQLHAPLRSSKRGFSLVSIQHPAKAREDRGQDYQSLQDDRIPDGGSGGIRKAVPVDAIENSPPGEGMREGACLESVNAVDEFDDRKQGTTIPGHGKTRGLEVTWRGRSASMPQNPLNRAGKERFVVISQRWKQYMKDVGYYLQAPAATNRASESRREVEHIAQTGAPGL